MNSPSESFEQFKRAVLMELAPYIIKTLNFLTAVLKRINNRQTKG